MSGTFSCVRARLVVVAKKPVQSQRKLRRVLILSSGTAETSVRMSRGSAGQSSVWSGGEESLAGWILSWRESSRRGVAGS